MGGFSLDVANAAIGIQRAGPCVGSHDRCITEQGLCTQRPLIDFSRPLYLHEQSHPVARSNSLSRHRDNLLIRPKHLGFVQMPAGK